MHIKKALKNCKRLMFIAICSAVVLLAASPLYIYNKFNTEVPVARLAFQQIGEQQYIAELRQGNFCQAKNFAIFGNQWQLDASFMKWQGIAVMLGFESRYRLDRLEGRYSNTKQQNNSPTLVHNLAPDVLLDIFADKQLNGKKSFLTDTTFGSSVYMDIDTQLIYSVYKTEDALIAKTEPKPRTIGNKGKVMIEINRACGDSPGLFSQVAETINLGAVSLLH